MDTRKLLLKATDIDNMPGERKVHFLNPNAVRSNKSLGDAVGLNHLGVHLIAVEPGKETTEYHKRRMESGGSAADMRSERWERSLTVTTTESRAYQALPQ